MALIKCPECGKEISDKSKQCIHCGYPLDELNQNKLFCLELMPVEINQKVKTIKAVREVTGFGLAEAKNIVDNSPCIFLKGLSYEKCKEIQKMFNTCGAITEIVEDNESTSPNTSLDNINISNLKKDIKIQPQVRCPYCNTGNVKKISGTSKAISIFGFGILSNKIGKQWHCNNCGSDF